MRVPAAGGRNACPAAQASPGQDSRRARGRAGCCARPAGGHACGEPVGRGGVRSVLSGPHGGSAKAVPAVGLTLGPDIDAYAAAALDDSSLEDARRQLDELYDHHLLTEPAPGRYLLHDLLREYARALVAADQPIQARAAVERLINFYVYVAAGAREISRPGRRPAGQRRRPIRPTSARQSRRRQQGRSRSLDARAPELLDAAASATRQPRGCCCTDRDRRRDGGLTRALGTGSKRRPSTARRCVQRGEAGLRRGEAGITPTSLACCSS